MPAPKIRSMGSFCDTTSRALSYFLGAGAVILAIAVVFTARPAAEIAEWAQNVLGWSFVLLLGSLVFIALFSWVRMLSSDATNDVPSGSRPASRRPMVSPR